VTTENWTFDELVSEGLHEKVREEYLEYHIKHGFIHEIIREFIKKGDMESDAYKLLDKKKEFISNRVEILSDIQRYLWNIKDGMPFNIKRSVGRYMIKFGLTAEQAEMFLAIHKKHMEAMGTENQKKYARPNVQNVVWNEEENCLHVHYEDIWWHYDKRGCWY
jgi:DNA-directed RNA polymerase subunit L